MEECRALLLSNASGVWLCCSIHRWEHWFVCALLALLRLRVWMSCDKHVMYAFDGARFRHLALQVVPIVDDEECVVLSVSAQVWRG